MEYSRTLIPQAAMMYDRHKGSLSDEGALGIFKQAIWVTHGKFFDREESEAEPGQFSLGSKKETVAENGFRIQFTSRTTDGDVALLRRVVATVAKVVRDITPQRLMSEMFTDSGAMMEQALRTKDAATGGATSGEVVTDVAARATEKLVPERVERYAVQTISRWRAALEGGISLVVDRAGLPNVFGGSEPDSSATPERLMEEKGAVRQPRVRINLDSLQDDPNQVAIVIGHEVAHSLGFNPTDCDASGHFADSREYVKDEREYGPKMLFDAYYFETLIQRL